MAVEAEVPLAQHLENLSDDREEWSLDSDMRLFEALKHFSASIVERSQAVENKIDSLCSRTVQTDVRLRNTFNEFLMLCNTQFIENRVYEEDETMAAEPDAARAGGAGDEGDEGAAPSEETMRAAWRVAVTAGAEALSQKLFFDDDGASQFDDGGADDEGAEDIYNARPLPFVIGTPGFLDSDDAGIGGPPPGGEFGSRLRRGLRRLHVRRGSLAGEFHLAPGAE